jgi:serine phosphatase RsbU (regulator of sigma subunit)
VAEGMDSKEIRFPVGVGIAGDVAKTLKTVNIPDAYKDDRFNPAFDKETNYRTKSILCMPMLNNEGALVGVVQVLNKKDGSRFDDKDESLLEALSVQAGVAIQRARLLEAFVEKQRIQESLKLAADIQMGMLPKDFPAFPKRDDFDLFASIIPAKEVGGDFYDFFLIDDDHLCFVIGDVSGKGVPAALFMAVTKTHVAASTIPGTEPSDILIRANDELCKENDQGMFCTIFYGILNTKTGEVRYSNGGHNPPYLVHADGSNEQLEGTEGIALGVMDGMDFGVNTLTLGKGEAIYLYTDGVNEAMDDDGNEYSYERLEEFLKKSKGLSTTDIVNGSLDDVKGFVKNAEQSDDITVLTVRYNG